MRRLLFLGDRAPDEALPALLDLGADVKAEALSAGALARARDLGPDALIADATGDPEGAFRLLSEFRAAAPGVALLCVLSPAHLDAVPWHRVADDFVQPGAGAAELRLRLEAVLARGRGPEGAVTRLGPVAINEETYQVTAGGRPLDLTLKEFELLRFLARSPGRVFTRRDLLREVWGYDFYGGTRTVDVHVRRLRAKLGPELEHLVETVRGVGYRAAVTEN